MMTHINPRIFSVLDRIAHPSTTGNDLNNTVEGLRRLLHGETPSEILRSPDPPIRPRHRSYDSFQAEIGDLRAKLKRAEKDKTASEHLRQSLIKQIAKLQLQLDTQSSDDPPKNGYYSRMQVTQIIDAMFGKDHGVRKALVEKNARLRKNGHQIPKVTDSLLQKWRREDQYPEWMVEQLRTLTSDDVLPRTKWDAKQKQFVIQLVNSNPHLTNQEIADAVYEEFGCRVTDSSIRGVLNRAGVLRVKLLGG